MTITIHRGTHQIGACVTEYSYDDWHLFVDYGEELPGTPKTGPLKIEHLTKGDLSKSALLITHYHGDHIGYITELPDEIPIYMGEVGREIQSNFSKHLSYVDKLKDKMNKMLERLETVNTFKAGVDFIIGPFCIMPITMDHSAFDAYAFKISTDKASAFHTGDFRTHGFRSKKFPKLIKSYIGKADYVVCEATNVTKEEEIIPERELQQQFINEFKANKGNIVYVATTNVDRIFSLYHAALKARRQFYVDWYQKGIMDVVVERDPLWTKSELYQYGKSKPEILRSTPKYRVFKANKIFKDCLQQKGYVLIARANKKFDNLIKKIPGEKVKYLSMWEGYVTKGNESYREDLVKSLGDDYKLMHTSGHCDMNKLEELFELLKPKGIIPIHTNDPEAFAKRFGEKWNVILLNDGESIEAGASNK